LLYSNSKLKYFAGMGKYLNPVVFLHKCRQDEKGITEFYKCIVGFPRIAGAFKENILMFFL